MRVLIITPTFSPDVGGVETMLTNLCAHLADRKYSIDVITYSPLIVRKKAPSKEVLGKYITIRRIPWVGLGLFNVFEHYPPIQFFYLVPGLVLGTLISLLKKKNRPDIIHAFGLSGLFAGGLLSRVFSIPCVVDMCTVYRLPERPFLAHAVRHLLNWPDYVRGNNPTGMQELLKLGMNPEKVGIITPPVDETVFKPLPQADIRAKLGLPQNAYIALFAGRMVESKQLDLAVDATRYITNPNVTFVFIGEGPLRHLVEDAALNDKRIRIFNNIPHHDLAYFYNAADILMCAPVDAQLIAFVGREALMCGLPILAPRTATYFGIPYQVNTDLIPSRVGLLFEANAQALAQNLNMLIQLKQDKKDSLFDRQACRRFALDNYSGKAMDWIGDSYQKAKYFRSHKVTKSTVQS